VIQAAIGGQAVTQVYEGEKHFDLTVRWLEPYRKSPRGHPRDHGRRRRTARIPLGRSRRQLEDGPAIIYREDGALRAGEVQRARPRPRGSTIAEAPCDKIREGEPRPYDTHLEWAGEINELNEAEGRLRSSSR
jgi:cobalt-zinc-cadmium resistance protein CzcA